MRISGFISKMLVVALLAAASAAQAPPASNKHEQRLPERFSAVYVDVERQPNDLPAIRKESGVRYFVLAFVNAGKGCIPVWPNSQPIAEDRTFASHGSTLRAEAGDTLIALGGYEGTELAQACPDVETLRSAYSKAVEKYKPAALDFDIEHLALDDQPSIDRRSQAIRKLEDEDPGLAIVFTLPATPAGLTDKAMNVLNSAVAQGVRIDIVNVMTMDYGKTAATKQMGDNAISAMRGARIQLQQLGLKAKLGITPMIGVNDAEGETFTLADAAQVLAFAEQNPDVAELAYWSAARDNGSCSGKVLPTCSGIAQKKWDFARIFTKFH